MIPANTATRVCNAIDTYRFAFSDERQLQDGLAQVLAAAGFCVEREVRLSPKDRIDLLIERIGIEVKVAGSSDSVLRQVRRYAATSQLDQLVLVSTRAAHRSLPSAVGGLPLRVKFLGGTA